MGLRHVGRELALKALYQIDLGGGGSNDDLALFFATFPADDRACTFALKMVDGVRRDQAIIDKQLANALEHWSVGRLSCIDHNILRIAVHELMRMDDVPTRVTIDEAIELAKTYGDQESSRFVNGVLDQVAERLNVKDKGEGRVSDKSPLV
jgi:transcription antitermination factor NusB